jgi:alanyl-tRNA synthetase
MPSEKEIKKDFRLLAQRHPEKHYPIRVLEEEGFRRQACQRCGTFFWSVEEREVCGEPGCSGGYTFIGDSPARVKMDFIETWRRFSDLFREMGYAPIPRYPVVARWREDAYFVQASIYDFQPYCVSGELDPPANPLVVPQFCLRFNDIENVGITGRHYTGFVMIGQHAFVKAEEYDPEAYLGHIYRWLTEGMGLPKEEVQFHEDAWAGGGNLGPSVEFFSRGLEIGNQVYMQYDIRGGEARELKIKVLDMGMGQERPAWFTHGTKTSYEVVFPTVVQRLYRETGVRPSADLLDRFLPHSGLLNVDEVENLEGHWDQIAGKLGVGKEELLGEILPLSALYSLGDHTRSLLLALADGALPSNVGGGYNLRALVRRSLDFIDRYGWEVRLPEICAWHAEYLQPQYPELGEHLEEVTRILEVEERKYRETKEKSRRIVAGLRGKKIGLDTLIELYDSHGISPEMVKREGLDVQIPPDFYNRVAERHEQVEPEAKTHKFKEFDLGGIPETEVLYYDDYRLVEFEARVVKVLEGKYVVLDRTAFYPTSGGQLYDTGAMNGSRVVNTFKQGNVILHTVSGAELSEGETVSCRIDWERRRQMAQHHTATHILNGVCRDLLGEHVWQAGAEKTLEKARLDITHYAALTLEELLEIENRANAVVAQNLKVESRLLRRDEAEKRFGFRLYQGGAVPGKVLRIIQVGDLDVEACGGTHLKRTGEAGIIKILGSTKIQDGVVRLEYAAGRAALEEIQRRHALLHEAASALSVSPDQLPKAANRFFEEWKRLKKENRELKERLASLEASRLRDSFEEREGYHFLVGTIEGGMEETVQTVRGLMGARKVILLLGVDNRISVVGACDPALNLDMGRVVKEVSSLLGGGGGGKPDFAKGSGVRKERLKEVERLVKDLLPPRI